MQSFSCVLESECHQKDLHYPDRLITNGALQGKMLKDRIVECQPVVDSSYQGHDSQSMWLQAYDCLTANGAYFVGFYVR